MKQYLRHIILLLTIILPSLLSAEEIHVGLASNFSEVSPGAANPYGDYFRNGAQLAALKFRKRLALKGIELVIDEFDYGNSVARVPDAVRRAVASQVVAVIGYNYSSHALVAAPLHQSMKLPMITPSATADRIATFDSFVHQGCFDNSFMGKILAQVAFERLKVKSAAIVPAVDCAYCQDLAHAFTRQFESLGGNVVVTSQTLEADTDFTKVVEKLKSTTFDVILVPNQELNSARVISSLVRAGITQPFLGGDGWGNVGSEFFAVLRDTNFQGYSVSHWHPDLNDPISNDLIQKYKQAFNKMPNDTSVLAFDAMSLLLTTILKAKIRDRAGIEEALNKQKYYTGVTGKFHFQKGTAPEKTIVLLSVKNKKFRIENVINKIQVTKAVQ